MATVTLTQLWVHEATDLSDYLALYWSEGGEDYQGNATREMYAAGRLRMETTDGAAQDLAFTLPWVTATELQSLRDRTDRVQMIRDSRGRLIWGFWNRVPVSERRNDTHVSVQLAVRQVTFDEAV